MLSIASVFQAKCSPFLLLSFSLLALSDHSHARHVIALENQPRTYSIDLDCSKPLKENTAFLSLVKDAILMNERDNIGRQAQVVVSLSVTSCSMPPDCNHPFSDNRVTPVCLADFSDVPVNASTDVIKKAERIQKFYGSNQCFWFKLNEEQAGLNRFCFPKGLAKRKSAIPSKRPYFQPANEHLMYVTSFFAGGAWNVNLMYK